VPLLLQVRAQRLGERFKQRQEPLQAIGDRAQGEIEAVPTPRGEQPMGWAVEGILVQEHLDPDGDAQGTPGEQPRRRRRREARGVRAARAGGPVAAAANQTAMGADRHFEDGGDVRGAAAGRERLTAGDAVPLVGGQVGRRVRGGEVIVVAAAVTGASALMAAAAAGRGRPGRGGAGLGRGVVGGGSAGQGVGDVMAFAAAAVEALFEQADFGLEVGNVLLELAAALLQAAFAVGLALGELLLESGLAEGSADGSAVVEGFIVVGLPACVAERLLAGGEGAGCLGWERFQEKVGSGHPREYDTSADGRVGW
jgi:hypothetical protein